MIVSNWDKERLLRSTILAGFAAALGLTGGAYAQEAEEDDEVVILEEEEEADSDERIVVTGSRIRRDEFSSIKPVQIISGEVARDVGLFDATEIIQESTVASARQIDATFIGFVSDNGPGATNVNLRGLGAQRTLTLINGRRVAPSGNEGAPNIPDLSLIPSSLIDRIDLLLDGASSVYGSDAVAGVVNVILRNDFDGFEVEASTTVPEQSGGETTFLSARWGVNSDRGFIGVGAEYAIRENLRRRDRDYFGVCQTPYEVTEDGEFRTFNADAFDLGSDSFSAGSPQFDNDCLFAFGINRISVPALGNEAFAWDSLYYLPGQNPLAGPGGAFGPGIPNFGEWDLFGVRDYDFDGVEDVGLLQDFWQQTGDDFRRIADVFSENETMNLFTFGEYNLGGQYDVVAFFEGGFANRQTRLGGESARSLSVAVAPDNPFNPCNPNTPASSPIQGVDCGAALNDLVVGLFGAPLSAFGFPDTLEGPRPVSTQLRVQLQGEDRFTTSENTQMRLLGGFRGTLPDPEFLPLRNITWEVAASYDRSKGETSRPLWDESNITLSALTTIEDPNNPGSFICGLDVDGDGIPDPNGAAGPSGLNDAPNCVPVNFFSPTLFGDEGGSFATQEEYEFLRADRDFRTTLEQTLVQGIISADLFELPAGTVGGVFGFEYREDTIDSNPSDTTREGGALGFFRDFGANGTRDLYEVFYEIEIPLIAQQPLIEELTINHSGRFTEESNFGNAYTYSASGIYRPNNWLTFRGGYGTSYRAPNLEEQFVEGISGFINGFTDPCGVPDIALVDPNPADGIPEEVYDPALDPRDPEVLINCSADGIDPTTLGGGNPTVSVEVFTVGNDVLQEETSRSYNAGFVFEQPWFDAFDFQFSATYYDILVEDTLIGTGLGFVSSQCYNDDQSDTNGDGVADNRSPFCGLLTRGADGLLLSADLPFANQDAETAVGVDYNMLVQREWTIFDRNVETGLDVRVNQTIERDSLTRVPGGEPILDENKGFQFFPEWNGTFRAFADYDDWRFTWNTRWIGATDDGEFTEAFADGTNTCSVGDGLLCKDVERIDDHFTHDASIRYAADTWRLVLGVSNVFDKAPAYVDPGENSTLSGTNRFVGHDFLGRRFFVNVSKSF